VVAASFAFHPTFPIPIRSCANLGTLGNHAANAEDGIGGMACIGVGNPGQLPWEPEALRQRGLFTPSPGFAPSSGDQIPSATYPNYSVPRTSAPSLLLRCLLALLVVKGVKEAKNPMAITS
jgi:hypothetical protein